MKYMNRMLLLFAVPLLLNCSGNEPIKAPADDEETPNYSKRLKSISYQTPDVPFSYDGLILNYNQEGKIQRADSFMWDYEISYPSDAVIEFVVVDDRLSNVKYNELKRFFIKDNKITHHTVNGTYLYANNTTSGVYDSVTYNYQNDRLVKIESFDKNKTLKRYATYTYANNNISEVKRSYINYKKVTETTTLTFTYDNTPRIQWSNSNYYAPLAGFIGFRDYPIIQDKLGKLNQNNITGITYQYDHPVLSPSFSSIQLTYVRNKDTNLLEEIKLKGHIKTDDKNSDYYPTKAFDKCAVVIEYEKYIK